MADHDSTIAAERIMMARACSIVGLHPRRMQQKADRQEIPGAIKIDGVWTFDEEKLRNWLADLEKQQCQAQKAAADAKPRRTANGAGRSSMAARGSTGSSAGGRYEQTMQKLLQLGSRKTSRG